jgi:cell division protein FtsQ
MAIAAYLVLAITAFNRPDELYNVCSEVKIDIQEGVVKGFLNAEEIKDQLVRAHLYPLGNPIDRVDSRKIEDALLQNPFVETAQCYKTQTGRIHINLSQRLPVIRVKANNGDDYYVDNTGHQMSNTDYVCNLPIATGQIDRTYAKRVLAPLGKLIMGDVFWRNQIEQVNVLPDGTIEMVPRVGDHVVYLGRPTRLEHKLARLEKFYKYGLSKAGWNKYSYINVEFDNQIICKKRQN